MNYETGAWYHRTLTAPQIFYPPAKNVKKNVAFSKRLDTHQEFVTYKVTLLKQKIDAARRKKNIILWTIGGILGLGFLAIEYYIITNL